MKKLYVGNLPFSATEDTLHEFFSQAGVNPSAVNLIRDRFTGQSRGFAFVEISNDEEADRAINSLNGQNFGGRNLVVNEARPQEQRGGGGGRRWWFRRRSWRTWWRWRWAWPRRRSWRVAVAVIVATAVIAAIAGKTFRLLQLAAPFLAGVAFTLLNLCACGSSARISFHPSQSVLLWAPVGRRSGNRLCGTARNFRLIYVFETSGKENPSAYVFCSMVAHAEVRFSSASHAFSR